MTRHKVDNNQGKESEPVTVFARSWFCYRVVYSLYALNNVLLFLFQEMTDSQAK